MCLSPRRLALLMISSVTGQNRMILFPLDRQWTCVTNKLVNQINHHLQQWRTQEARSFGVISASTQFIKPLSKCPGLSEAQQINFIETVDTVDLPSNDILSLGGDPFVLIRNIDTRSGLLKGRRCCVIQIKNRTVVFQF
jgi:type 1 fimbria pilin